MVIATRKRPVRRHDMGLSIRDLRDLIGEIDNPKFSLAGTPQPIQGQSPGRGPQPPEQQSPQK